VVSESANVAVFTHNIWVGGVFLLGILKRVKERGRDKLLLGILRWHVWYASDPKVQINCMCMLR